MAVCGILLQVNVDTLGDLEEPTPLGLQGVHVGLHEHRVVNTKSVTNFVFVTSRKKTKKPAYLNLV